MLRFREGNKGPDSTWCQPARAAVRGGPGQVRRSRALNPLNRASTYGQPDPPEAQSGALPMMCIPPVPINRSGVPTKPPSYTSTDRSWTVRSTSLHSEGVESTKNRSPLQLAIPSALTVQAIVEVANNPLTELPDNKQAAPPSTSAP